MRLHSAPHPVRVLIFYAVLFATALALIGRLAELQIAQYDTFLDQAVENRISRLNEPAPRGIIVDRRGVLLAENLPSFAVAITPARLPDDPDPFDGLDPAPTQAIYRRLSELLNMPISVPGSTPRQECATGRGIKDWVDEGASIAPFRAVKIKCDVDKTTALVIRQELEKLPGVDVIVEPVRNYPTGALTANVVGYMAPIPAPQDAPLTYAYYVNERDLLPGRDRIGVAGVEFSQQDLLAGQNGSRLIERDVAGEILRLVEETTPTVPGLNVQLTIDVRMQAAAEAALTRRMNYIRTFTGGNIDYTQGVAIVMNPNTGEVLAMVSFPSYDNNRFARFIDYDYFVTLSNTVELPLLNHAVQVLYPPGSVFKIVTATGALAEGVIDPDKELEDEGLITVRNRYFPNDPGKARDFVCWNREGHGLVSFTRGIAESCNVYFYKIGGGWEPEGVDGLGINLLGKWMEIFGFGSPTGVELNAEAGGIIPNSDWKRRNYGENWSTGDTYNAVIGQGYVTVTPLQLLNAYNAIINGGTLYRPTVIDKYLDAEGLIVNDTQPAILGSLLDFTSRDNIALVQAGFRQVVTDGTLAGDINLYGETDPIVNLETINAAGKTGTAEYCDRRAWALDRCIPGSWPAHAWTVMYAPYENPEVSVVVFVYDGTEGSKIAGPIASRILQAYFQLKAADAAPTGR